MDSRTQAEFQFEEWYDSKALNTHLGEKEELPTTKRRKTDTGDAIPLAYRPRVTDIDSCSSDEHSDPEEFILVHRPTKPSVPGNSYPIDNTPSSPEALSGPYSELDKDSLFYGSDDEQWATWDNRPQPVLSDEEEWSLL